MCAFKTKITIQPLICFIFQIWLWIVYTVASSVLRGMCTGLLPLKKSIYSFLTLLILRNFAPLPQQLHDHEHNQLLAFQNRYLLWLACWHGVFHWWDFWSHGAYDPSVINQWYGNSYWWYVYLKSFHSDTVGLSTRQSGKLLTWGPKSPGYTTYHLVLDIFWFITTLKKICNAELEYQQWRILLFFYLVALTCRETLVWNIFLRP